MDNEIMVEIPQADLVAKRNNYELTIGNYTATLVRNVDFGKVPKAQKPSLWKSGAEKVLMGFGLYYDTVLTDTYKDYGSGFFYYEFTARAYDQKGRVVRSGVGCANTAESGNGMANGFNTANSAMKKAKKRAVVDLALTIASLSDAFTQDLEDEKMDKQKVELVKDYEVVTPKQIKRMFAIANQKGITHEEAKAIISSMGYVSSKDITQKDYDTICEKLENYKI